MDAVAKRAGNNCAKDETVNIAPAKFKRVPEGLLPVLNPEETSKQFNSRLCQNFNTQSPELANYLVSLIATHLKGESEIELNAMVAAVAQMQPRDTVEVLLICQMLLVNRRALMALRDIANAHLPESQAQYTSMAASLLRLYTQQMQALRKYRNAGSQNITVNYVTANQSVVGVTTGGVQ